MKVLFQTIGLLVLLFSSAPLKVQWILVSYGPPCSQRYVEISGSASANCSCGGTCEAGAPWGIISSGAYASGYRCGSPFTVEASANVNPPGGESFASSSASYVGPHLSFFYSEEKYCSGHQETSGSEWYTPVC